MTMSIGDSAVSTLREREPDSGTAPPAHSPTTAQRQPSMRDTTTHPADASGASGSNRYGQKGSDAVPGRHSPSVDKPAVAAAASTPPARAILSGATRVELQQLLDAHDTQTLPNGATVSRSVNQDQENTARLGKTLDQSFTGYPPMVQQFEQTLNDMQPQLGMLPPVEREAYAGALATLDVAYRNGDAQARQNVDGQLSLLRSALSARATAVDNDPVQQTLDVFNQPVGAGYLSQPAEQRQLGALTQLRERFVAAATPDARRACFNQAAELKNGLQHKIATTLDRQTTQEAGKWAEANTEVDRILHEAEAVTGDPGKRYELIGRQLYSTNPGTGRDDLADRRILAFTQRMQDDPALHDKLTGWSVDAGRKLNGYGVDSQKDYLDILQNLPPAGPDYVRDLADQYNAVLHDASYKDASITPAARAEKLADQILEGTARFMLCLTPFAPLTAALDAHSSLSDNARLGIDLTASLLGLVAGEGATAFAERLAAKGATAVAAVTETAAEARLPAQPRAVGEGPRKVPSSAAPAAAIAPAKPSGAAATTTGAYDAHPDAGLPVDPTVAEASQRVSGKPASFPDDYALQTAPGSLKPAAGQKGVLTDKHGQHYIQSDGHTYAARFDEDNHTWRVYDADNPYRPQCPVRLDTQGHWQVHNDVGLKGGMNPQAAPIPVIELPRPFAQAYRVATSNGAPPSSEILQTLNPPSWHSAADRWQGDPAFIARHRDAFSRLHPEQQQAIRNWTYLDVSDGYSSDGSYEDVNYELNRQLNHRRHESDTAMRAEDLQGGLDGLPKPEGSNRLIRTASVPGNYARTLAPGDYVTNSPAFMSASSENTFAEGTLAEGHPRGGAGHAFAIYDIQSTSATPFVGGISTNAGAEREWLFAPGTVFRVEEIATATPLDGSAPRIGVRLVEVPFNTPIYAKNIHTGTLELVYPHGMTPVYTTLRPTRSPSLQIPPPASPTQPPLPAHGDPNQPGASTVQRPVP